MWFCSSDEVDRVLTAHFDTEILPRIGPTAYGGEVTEGKHLGRTIRWSPQGFEWESNNKHVEDMVELCGLKLGSKGAPTPITKATGRGRRDIDDTLNEADAQTFRQAAGTGSTCRSVVHHSQPRRRVDPVLAGQSDPLFEPARWLMTTPLKIYCRSTKKEWKGSHNKID